MSWLADLHVSRSWSADPFAPGCGCDLADCGLVLAKTDCEQHGLKRPRTLRNVHRASDCPATKQATSLPTEEPQTDG